MRKYCWISITLQLFELFSELTGIIMTPTRELALQIFRECKKFCKPLNLRAVCVYGVAAEGRSGDRYGIMNLSYDKAQVRRYFHKVPPDSSFCGSV